jgi:tetratricopeptide (TPR) repeat protein
VIRRTAFLLLASLSLSPRLRAEPADDSMPAVVPLPAVRASAPAPDRVALHEMQVHFLIATEYYKDGNYEAAINEWKQVLKIQPNHQLSKEKILKAREKIAAKAAQ